MTTRSTRGTRGAPSALALLTLLALLVVAPAARAEADAPPDTDTGWRKVLSYARCAFEVFRAVTPAEWSVAFFDCSRLYLSEPPLTGGGAG